MLLRLLHPRTGGIGRRPQRELREIDERGIDDHVISVTSAPGRTEKASVVCCGAFQAIRLLGSFSSGAPEKAPLQFGAEVIRPRRGSR